MNRIHTQADWANRARAVLPAGGFGNFEAGACIARGEGARVWDEDGREYVDYLIGSGPMLVGHSHPEVLEAVMAQLPLGQTFFANNARGIELAEEICAALPCAEMLRYVSSGGEADMYAMRLARAATGRPKILKFEGGYHGMCAEAQMSLAPTRRENFPRPVPDSAGIPDSVTDEVLVAPFNDPETVSSLLAEHGAEIAGIIVEPLQRILPPAPGFLAHLRAECDRYGIVLIFDEVVTGFRFDYGGAQSLYGVTPDLCTLGKVIGGGFPLAAIAGNSAIMAHFDKAAVGADRWLMQLGTLSGNPIAAVAGLKTLEILRRPGAYAQLRSLGVQVQDIFRTALEGTGLSFHVVGDPTLFEIVFSARAPQNYRDVQAADAEAAARWNAGLRAGGLFKSAGKTYPCLALTDADLETTRAAAQSAAAAL